VPTLSRPACLISLVLACMSQLWGATAQTAHAHPDDPKVEDIMPRYEGPGFRSGGEAGPHGGGDPSVFNRLGIELLSWISLPEFGPQFDRAADIWGYTSPSGREYAIIGLSAGTAFVEITDPGNPTIVEILSGPNSIWRDMKTYQHYAYAVSEGGSGIQVFDLDNIDGGNVDHVNTVTCCGTTATHNVAIDETSGFLYRCGGGNNGLRIYSLANPASPSFVGSWSERYVHDAEVVTYTSGPYAGRQIVFACSGFNGGSVDTGLDILDVTSKSNIFRRSQVLYPNGQFSHQGWLSNDRQVFYLGDELDEQNLGVRSTTIIIDVADLDNAFFAGDFANNSAAVTHNLFSSGDLILAANYRSGLRIFDASNTHSPYEICFFDTFPGSDSANFNGLWGVYSYFASGSVIGSDIERGLFVWDMAACQPAGLTDFPFFDDFAGPPLDASAWTSLGADVNNLAIAPPSGAFALNLGGNSAGGDQVASALIDLDGLYNATLSYYIQRTGAGASPNPGEDLVVEYLNTVNNWIQINRHFGDGPDQTDFDFATVHLPPLAMHANFRVRFRVLSAVEAAADWFLDDVSITPGDNAPPQPDPGAFAVVPTALSPTEIQMEAVGGSDADSPPVQYMFEVTSSTIGGSSSPWSTSLVYIDDGLLPNTPYAYCARGRDSAPNPVETGCSNPAGVTTHVETPEGVNIDAVTETSVALSTQGLLSWLFVDQSAAFFDSLTPGGDGGINAWRGTDFFGQPATDVAIGLTPNTEYVFRVKARNRQAVETPYSPTTAVYTLAAAPGPISLVQATDTTLALSLDSSGNPPATEFAIQCVATTDANWNGRYADADGAPATAPVWRSLADWGNPQVTGLLPGTNYTFVTIARNGDLVETAPGPASGFATDAVPSCNLLGDIDGNGLINGADVAGFIRAKLDTAEPADQPACADYATGTLSGDVAAFADALLGN